ncbi:cytochrome c [Emticicia sp. C21]|uniref:c-type cytochrome n=1 Tax=Emticicia sp. C21 TaxID=2302915 RepID=UPI000E342D48|nr:cytochrome c [Emticicia sp. C21]RFS18045.1 cytochrome c [Emticicia sp. C21]
MDTQKTLVKVLELFKTLAILFGLSWVIFAATAFYYINNQSPEPLPGCATVTNEPNINEPLSSIAIKGKALFKDNCAQCHAPTNEQIVGPGLADIESRRDIGWLRKWIRNPQKVLDSKDKYANALYEKFNRTQMTAFPNFTDEDIDAILKYLAESDKAMPLALP